MSQILTLNGGGGGGGTAVTKIQGDVGGPVSPTGAGIIDLFGGTGILVTGNPGANTVTIATTGTTTVAYHRVNASPYIVNVLTDEFLGADVTGIPINIQLPNLPPVGRVFMIKDIFGNAAANNITITVVGGITLIDGVAAYVMNTNFSSVQVVFDGVFYSVF
jgi:hypothetical protein